jgi:hypothetical protein
LRLSNLALVPQRLLLYDKLSPLPTPPSLCILPLRARILLQSHNRGGRREGGGGDRDRGSRRDDVGGDRYGSSGGGGDRYGSSGGGDRYGGGGGGYGGGGFRGPPPGRGAPRKTGYKVHPTACNTFVCTIISTAACVLCGAVYSMPVAAVSCLLVASELMGCSCY